MQGPRTFGLPPIGDEAVISITLNTQITNVTNDDGDVVMGLTYTDGTDGGGDPALGKPAMGTRDDYKGEGKEVLSDGGTTITWTIPTAETANAGGITFYFPVAGCNGNYQRNHGQRLRAGGR